MKENLESENRPEQEVTKITAETEIEKPPLEERVAAVLEQGKQDLSRREAEHDKKTLSGVRRVVTGLVIGLSFLAVGCNSEKGESKAPEEEQKINNTSDGFTDNAQKNVKQRLKLQRDQIEHMKKSK